MQTRVEATGAVILTLIGGTYGSDAAFERACGLPPKTVSNWRRGRCASYMKSLPIIADRLGVDVAALLSPNAPTEGMTPEEQTLLDAFRKTRGLPPEARAKLLDTLLTVIDYRQGGLS